MDGMEMAFYAFLDRWVAQHEYVWVGILVVLGLGVYLSENRKVKARIFPLFAFLLFSVTMIVLYPRTLEVCGIHDFGKGLWSVAEIHESHANRYLLPALFLKRWCEPIASPWLINGTYLFCLAVFPAWIAWAIRYGLKQKKTETKSKRVK